ncbi:MAG TPA: phage terminase large subunit [Methanothrix sp.]|nr:phage terminase large subunit [Methanothrix sp.]HOL44722.1 phage terminase large subunit [Methanothrix sp.]
MDITKISWDAIRARKARDSLLEFTQYTFPTYKVNWHHRVLCDYLERWAFGDIKRLMVFMPPRSGKSELVSRRLPAWIFGKFPDAQIIAASYSMDLASKMNRDVQRIIDCDEYRRVFPGVGLSRKLVRDGGGGTTTWLRNSEIFEIVGHKGIYKCSGIGGGITGMGFTHGIIDDPIKDRREAESRAMSETLWDWYTSTFYTRRMNDDARILITMTRWTKRDLAGRLLELQEEDPSADRWTVVSFPMIAEGELSPEDPRKPGEPLWPERFSSESLQTARATMGPYDWAALMQQNPIESGGTVFNRGWWRFYDEEPFELAKKMDELVQSWDMTFAGGPSSDYVVGQVWGRRGADKFLIDQVRFQGDFVETVAAFRRLSEKWPRAVRKLVEKKANGDAVIATLRHEIAGIIPVSPLGGKLVRARAVAPEVESGNVYLPSGRYCPWVHEFIEEVSLFPNVKHDDQTDAFTQAIANMLDRGTYAPPQLPAKPVIVTSGVENLFSTRGGVRRYRKRLVLPQKLPESLRHGCC